ncbi:MAG TPA: MATE family efflux transporter [Pseudomonadales bacterium]|nr:MATE family efflux transporter [Gammaproteobacteria bacterium]HIM35637.1 MATE family efflux transporter [Pseudomonadales bacterium]
MSDRHTGATFTEGSVGRHLLRLGSFITMGSLSMNFARLVEAVYLGWIGTEALAALGFAFPVTITLFAFAGGIGTGASSVIARSVGSGDGERAAVLVTHAQLLVLVVGSVIGLLGFWYAEIVITALGATGEVREMAVDYLTVYMLGFPLFMLSMVGSTLLRATGRAASPGIVMTTGSVLQMAFGPVLIFGWFGLPALGIAGAAWAYVLSRVFSVSIYLALLVRARMIRRSMKGFWQSFAAIVHVGGPATASGLIQPVSMLIITRLLAAHGHEVVAGYNVAMRVETMVHMVLWGVSSSVGPFVGQNWGAGQFQRARQALSLSNRFCLAWGLVTFVVLFLGGDYFVRLIDDNETVGAVARMFFLIVPLSIGFMGVMQVASTCFNALGRPAPPLIIALLRTFVMYVPIAILANWVWGYPGIFAATALTNVVMGTIAWDWNRRTMRMGSSLSTRERVQISG